MKKIIISIIIAIAMIASYFGYQRYMNNLSHADNNVEIQSRAADGGACTENSDCQSGNCDTSSGKGICKGSCAGENSYCTSDGQCCHSFCDIATQTCGWSTLDTEITAAAAAVGATGGMVAAKKTIYKTGYQYLQSSSWDPSMDTPEDLRFSIDHGPRQSNLGLNEHGPRQSNPGLNKRKPIKNKEKYKLIEEEDLEALENMSDQELIEMEHDFDYNKAEMKDEFINKYSEYADKFEDWYKEMLNLIEELLEDSSLGA